MRHRRRLTGRATLAVALSLGSAVTGCSGPIGPGSPPAATKLSQEQAYAQVALTGPAETPLYWEIDPPTDPRAASAVATTQHYESLVAFLLSRVDEEMRELLPQLATAAEVERIDRILRMPRNPDAVQLIGPRWIGLLDARTGAREAVVVMCFDKGYWTESGLEGQPRPDGLFRSDVSVYRLREDTLIDGGRQWRVDQVTFNAVEVSEPGLALTEEEIEANKQRCADWATHTPADVPRR